MTSALLRRPVAAAGATHARLPKVGRLTQRLRGDDGAAQFARFVFVGGVSSALYALLYLLLDGLGDQPANIAGAVATALALGWFDSVAGDDSPVGDLLVVAVVTGAIGLIRFVALRWVFGARTPERA